MNYFIIILAIVMFQDIPLKPKEEFEVKLDYQFRQRPLKDHNTVHLGQPVKNFEQRSGGTVLPHLTLNIHLLKLQEEKMRMRVGTNLNGRELLKKVTVEDVVVLDLGFTDDMVDRVTAYQYTLTLLNSAREPVEKILISVEEDGSFLVNGEKRGKF